MAGNSMNIGLYDFMHYYGVWRTENSDKTEIRGVRSELNLKHFVNVNTQYVQIRILRMREGDSGGGYFCQFGPFA